MELKKILFAVIILTVCIGYSQKVDSGILKESFEAEASLINFKNNNSSKLSISKKHRQFGESSLQWEYEGQSFFGTSKFQHLSQNDSPLKYGDHFPASPILVMSIYNEISQNEIIKISYEKNGKEQVWFPVQLNFTGWRTVWVPFYEMYGNPPKRNEKVDYDFFKVSSNSKHGKGKLFFDDIVFSQYQDDRHSYPDAVVPFIKRDLKEGEDHWMPLLRDLKRTNEIEKHSLTENQKKDLSLIEKRIDATFNKIEKKTDNLLKAQEEFSKLHLATNGTLLGPPLVFQIEQVYFDKNDVNRDNFLAIEQLGKSLKKLANFYLQSTAENKHKIAEMFVTATKYYLDQGWQEGSSGGTRHHIGYNVRELTDAFYIMKEPLKEANILNEVGSSLQWIFNLGKLLGPVEEFHANIDYFNTQSFSHLMLIFMSDDREKQMALIQAYSKYISITLAQDTGIGVFKIDGTSWHHGGHYPAYGLGAFSSIPPVIHTLSGTQFRINEEGHKNFKKAFLTTRLYSQSLDYGFGNSGRHPLENNSFNSLRNQYLQMAYSGNPEGTAILDADVAAAYLRLWGKSDKLNTAIFKETNGIKEDKLPGYHVLPYAATSIHRRKNWAAFIKGYSKYVWASEIYVDENRYGRYPANGSIQINNDKGNIKSGFKQEGWDWNGYPGTTVIYLPFKELEPNTPLLMFRSDETFAGAVVLNGNGVFGMKLNESKGSNADGDLKKIGFPGKLKANKSVFSFGEKLICIGTGISSVDSINPVQTNLFQNYLPKSSEAIYLEKAGIITEFPYSNTVIANNRSKNWVVDAYQNGYHILSENNIEIRKKAQQSYHNKYSVNTGRMNKKGNGATITHGDFASSWITHGIAPKNASYQYVIYPSLTSQQIESFDKKVNKDKSYEILRADNIAHIVKDNQTSTTAFVIFEAEKDLSNKLLKRVSEPSLLMIKDAKNSITISAVQPDLNFEEVEEKTERGYSFPVELTITLHGNWKLKENSNVKSIQNIENETRITLQCQHGFSNIISLNKL